MSRKNWIVLIAVIVLLAAALGVGMYVRHQQQEKETAGAITLRMGGKDITIAIASLNKTAFEGETVDGKGDRSSHSYRGVLLSSLLKEKGADLGKVNGVSAISADQYTAQFTGDEIRENGRIYLAVEIDGKQLEGIDSGTLGVQAIVFGDENMRRCVRNLSVIEIIQ